MYKNVAGQKWTVFAFDLTDNTPLTGDAAQITANLRIDGVQNTVDDANPTELEDGYYEFDLTQAETNGDLLVMCPDSSTANIQVIGVPGAVWTNEIKALIEDVPTVAEFEARSIVAADYVVVGDTIAGVTTCTTNTDMRGTDSALTDKAGFALSAAGIDSIHDEEVDNDGTAISLRGAMRLILSALTGKDSGGGTATLVFRDINDTKNRLSVTVDSSGNRTAVGTRDAS